MPTHKMRYNVNLPPASEIRITFGIHLAENGPIRLIRISCNIRNSLARLQNHFRQWIGPNRLYRFDLIPNRILLVTYCEQKKKNKQTDDFDCHGLPPVWSK